MRRSSDQRSWQRPMPAATARRSVFTDVVRVVLPLFPAGTVTTVSPTFEWSLATALTTHRTSCADPRVIVTVTEIACGETTRYDCTIEVIPCRACPAAAQMAQAANATTANATTTTPVRRRDPRGRP